jgi:branched-chain amino acid transport system permease protein
VEWDKVVLFAALGLGSGALIAGLALSLILTYRGSGIINLAAGAVAMVTGFAFWSFRTGSYGVEFSTVPAVILAFLVAIALGFILEFLAFRPLRTASPLAKLVASLGLLLTAQAAILLAFGSDTRVEPEILPTGNVVEILGESVPVVNFILAGIVIAIAAVLSAVYRWTRFGLATRAASENEVSAMLAGLSPASLSLINTLLACIVAGMLGVLAGPVIQLDSATLPLQVVPALAAALFAGFTSFGIACAVGLLIGMVENNIYYLSTQSWFPTDHGAPMPGVQELVVFLIIVIAMFWRGAKLPRRGELIERRLPPVPKPERLLRPALITLVLGAAALIIFPYDFRQALMNTIIAAVLALSLMLITGFVGQISVVQLALSGGAGFVVSLLATHAGITFPLAPLIGACVATILGLLIGVSALRVRGVQLAVVTLAAAVAIEQFWFANATWGGGQAGARVPQPEIFGLNIGNDASFKGLDGKVPSPMLGIVILVFAILLAAFVANLRRTGLGQRMLAVRSNERAAAAVGINVRNMKLTAFGIGSFIAGIAGAMYAYNFGSVSADRFSALTAFGLIAFVFVGGITMVSGAVIAGLIATEGLFPHAWESWFGLSGTWALLLGGIFLVFNLVFYPEGVAGASYKKKQQKRRLREAGLETPSTLQLALNRGRKGVSALTSIGKS